MRVARMREIEEVGAMTAGIVRLISLFVAVMMVLEHAAFAQRPSPGEILFDDRTLSSATTEIIRRCRIQS